MSALVKYLIFLLSLITAWSYLRKLMSAVLAIHLRKAVTLVLRLGLLEHVM